MNINTKIPSDVKEILTRLEKGGYRADIVGGPVRDLLMGKTPSDYDITTSAEPTETKAVFCREKTVDTGIKHGTVSLSFNGEQYEITTYRTDGEYLDSRHPESVSFSKRIEDDLCRRDFTVNAISYNLNLGITDLHGGIRDIEDRIIRAVGDPHLRFSEDALRILRALRFAATLGFEIESATAAALRAKSQNLRLISKERIFTELKKLISGDNSYKIIRDFKDVILTVIPELSPLNMPSEAGYFSLNPKERAALIFLENGCENNIEAVLKSLHSDNKSAKEIEKIASAAGVLTANEEKIRELMLKCSKTVLSSAASVALAGGRISKEDYSFITDLNDSNVPRTVAELKISGEDVKAQGYGGREIGKVLEGLIYAVCVKGLENDKTALVNYIKK